MKTRATPADYDIRYCDDTQYRHNTQHRHDTSDRIETYARTNSDGRSELVLYNPGETDEWIKATPSDTVELEDWR